MGRVETTLVACHRFEIEETPDGWGATVYAHSDGVEVDFQVYYDTITEAWQFADALSKASVRIVRMVDEEPPRVHTLGDLLEEQMARQHEMEEVYHYLCEGMVVAAIKKYRDIASCSLVDAKEAIDNIRDNGLHLED